MEQYIVKVVIETTTGKVVGTSEFNTATIAEIKAFGGGSIVDKFISDTIQNIADDRKDNPHHHQNRKD